jgi:voltage-gated potassium channel Kch
MSAFFTGDWVGAVQLAVFVTTAILALRSTSLPRRWIRVGVTVGAAGSVAALILVTVRPANAAVGAASLWTGLLLLATVVLIVRSILSYDSVTIQSIFAAISSYLIIGLMFAAFYAAEARFHGGNFFVAGEAYSSQNVQYFSFTTLTTLGYGDFTAAENGGRAIAVIEALAGQIFLATLVARLVAAFRGPAARAAPSASPAPSDDAGPAAGDADPAAGNAPADGGEPPPRA